MTYNVFSGTLNPTHSLTLVTFLGRVNLVSISHKVAWVEAYLHTKRHLNPSSHLATTDMGRKLGAVPLRGGGAGFPSNNVARAETSYLHANVSSIHPTVWPTLQRDRQLGQDKQLAVWWRRANRFSERVHVRYIHVSQKRIPPNHQYNFNSSCPIPLIFGTNIAE